MSDDRDDFTKKRLQLKKQFLNRAIGEGRGPQAIAALNRLYTNIKATKSAPDEDILKNIDEMAQQERAEISRIIQECLEKTDFNRQEPEDIREYMILDLTEQELTIDLLRKEGMPEDKLPKLSLALARLNAYEHLKGGEQADAWSDNNKDVRNARNKARLILNMESPSPLFH